ncbi:MAG: OmpH family outer membrane protein, partial [Flavobacteriaceae bacterium]
MKVMNLIFRNTLCLLLLIISSFTVFAQRGTRVGYIDMDYILESVEEYNKASLLLDKTIENWKKEIELKKLELQQYRDQLNAERIILTPE